jgi:DNA-directed RNA polymerase specialized sigma24 family protein
MSRSRAVQLADPTPADAAAEPAARAGSPAESAPPPQRDARTEASGARAPDGSARSKEESPRPKGRARDDRDGDARRRSLLAGGTPREILCRIVQGDPLELRAHVARRLRADAYVFDADRVHLRALARCARFANRYPGRPDLDEWLDQIVREAIEDLLREDLELARSLDRDGAEPSAAFTALARPLGLDPAAMRRACAAFNRLGAADREAFFELLIEGRSLDELARARGEGATELARRARRALEVLLHERAAADAQDSTGEVRP